jgi:hypothetical protein
MRAQSLPMSNIVLSESDKLGFIGELASDLNNFILVAKLTKLIVHRAQAGKPVPSFSIRIDIRTREEHELLNGENLGLFFVPAVKCAMIESRRALKFFGITEDRETGTLKAMIKKQYPTDIDITDFGLPLVKPTELLDVASKYKDAEKNLITTIRFTDKRFAHFTNFKDDLYMSTLQIVPLIIYQAYETFLFRPLRYPMPNDFIAG